MKALYELNIDFDLLKKQKLTILKIAMTEGLLKEDQYYLIGIIRLIDKIQDIAVDQYGLPESIIFEFSNEK
jgi:hypothetical protein